jgi:membrane protein DedA with SNARE-associated domain
LADAQDTSGASGASAGPAKPDPWSDPRLPWNGKPSKQEIICYLGIVFSGFFYLLLIPWRASLLGTHPVISELLNGSMEAIIAAAAFARTGHGTFIVALLAAVPGLMKFDVFWWWAGHLWEDRIILLLSGKSQRGAKYMERVRTSGRKFLWPAVVVSYFLPIPTAIIYVVAGWAGMRLITFLILDVLGALLWAGLLAGLGYAIGHPAVSVAKTISHYGLYFTIGLVVLIVFFQMRSMRASKRAGDWGVAYQRSGSAGSSGSGTGTDSGSGSGAGVAGENAG